MTAARDRSYQRLSIAEKRTEDLSRAREPSVRCPHCETMVMPADLLAHIDSRCPGPREPGPGSRWVTHGEAMALGVPRATLSYWASNKQVRFFGGRQDRKYLHRDLVVKIAQHRSFRRR